MSKPKEITPEEVLDYKFNWATELGTDTIQSSSINVGSGLTLHSTSNDATTVTVVVKSGVLKRSVFVTNTIMTASGLTQARAMLIKVVEHKLS